MCLLVDATCSPIHQATLLLSDNARLVSANFQVGNLISIFLISAGEKKQNFLRIKCKNNKCEESRYDF